MTDTKHTLKPCPFCGGIDVNDEGRTQSNKGQMFCWDCGASGPHPAYDTVYPVPDWNTRPQEEANQATIKELTEALGVAVQLAEIASDWNLSEVEIDSEMRDIWDVCDVFLEALKKAGAE